MGMLPAILYLLRVLVAGKGLMLLPLTHRVLENGIHEFVVNDASHEAMDRYVEVLAELLSSAPPDATIRYLFDYTTPGTLPFIYGAQRVRQEIVLRFPNRPPSRGAILHPASTIVALFAALVHVTGSALKDKVRFFPADQRDAAIAWVLADE